jgi:hypothetical protein
MRFGMKMGMSVFECALGSLAEQRPAARGHRSLTCAMSLASYHVSPYGLLLSAVRLLNSGNRVRSNCTVLYTRTAVCSFCNSFSFQNVVFFTAYQTVYRRHKQRHAECDRPCHRN